MLMTPSVMFLLYVSEKRESFEKRKKASFPLWNAKEASYAAKENSAFGKQFGEFCNDNFPLRETLLDLYQWVHEEVFMVNPFPERVVEGKNGWLFLGDMYSEALKESKGLVRFSEPELKKAVTNMLAVRSALDSMGITFSLAVAPNKLTVCGEYLPVVHSGKPTKLDQLKQALSREGVELIDLKEGFDHYPSKSLFFRQDTHWNGFGGFLGYQNLVKGIRASGFPDFPMISRHMVTIAIGAGLPRDLNAMRRKNSTEHAIFVNLIKKTNVKKLPSKLPPPKFTATDGFTYERRFSSPGKPLKILIFHDSFFWGIHGFLNGFAGESVFLHSLLDMDVIVLEKPDLVIFEIVERHLDQLMWINPSVKPSHKPSGKPMQGLP
jgi:hypothetical protein